MLNTGLWAKSFKNRQICPPDYRSNFPTEQAWVCSNRNLKLIQKLATELRHNIEFEITALQRLGVIL